MTIPVVAIHEEAASYRRGLEAAFAAAGYRVAADDDDGADVVVVTADDDAAEELHDPVRRVAPVRVVLLADPSPESHARALRRGATATAAWSAEPEQIVAVASAARDGMTLLPAAVAGWLARRSVPAGAAPEISVEEASWLASLAAGETVARLADEAGYSERAMFRKLDDLYGRLRVRNRSEALVAAERFGLLGGDDS